MARGTTTWNPRGDEPGTNMGREGGEDRGIQHKGHGRSNGKHDAQHRMGHMGRNNDRDSRGGDRTRCHSGVHLGGHTSTQIRGGAWDKKHGIPGMGTRKTNQVGEDGGRMAGSKAPGKRRAQTADAGMDMAQRASGAVDKHEHGARAIHSTAHDQEHTTCSTRQNCSWQKDNHATHHKSMEHTLRDDHGGTRTANNGNEDGSADMGANNARNMGDSIEGIAGSNTRKGRRPQDERDDSTKGSKEMGNREERHTKKGRSTEDK